MPKLLALILSPFRLDYIKLYFTLLKNKIDKLIFTITTKTIHFSGETLFKF